MNPLNSLERDAIGEAFNLGMGAAGSALSEMLGQEVVLSVPNVNIEKRAEAAYTVLRECSRHNEDIAEQAISGVREHFAGPFAGHALLLFPQKSSLELVRLLLQQPESDAEWLSEMELEALVEVGNIILNACLSSIAEIVGDEISNEIPEAVKGTVGEILSPSGDRTEQDYVMNLHMHFSVHEVHIEGDITFIMDIRSLDVFRAKVAEYFGFDAA